LQVSGYATIYKPPYASSPSFTFATVKNAGHMVPSDQPLRGLTLFHRFVAREPIREGNTAKIEALSTMPDVFTVAAGADVVLTIKVKGDFPPYIFSWWQEMPNAAPRQVTKCEMSSCNLGKATSWFNGKRYYVSVNGLDASFLTTKTTQIKVSGLTAAAQADAGASGGISLNLALGLMAGSAVVAMIIENYVKARIAAKGVWRSVLLSRDLLLLLPLFLTSLLSLSTLT